MNSQRGAGVSAGRRGSSVASVQLLERIVDHLEQNPLSITTKNTEVNKTPFCLSVTHTHLLSYFIVKPLTTLEIRTPHCSLSSPNYGTYCDTCIRSL